MVRGCLHPNLASVSIQMGPSTITVQSLVFPLLGQNENAPGYHSLLGGHR